MKKLIALLMAMTMVLSLCACGEKEPEFDVSESIRSSVRAESAFQFASPFSKYTGVKSVMLDTLSYEDNGDGTYICKGKVLLIDDYGDKYTCKYDAVVEVDMETEESDCIEYTIVSNPEKIS